MMKIFIFKLNQQHTPMIMLNQAKVIELKSKYSSEMLHRFISSRRILQVIRTCLSELEIGKQNQFITYFRVIDPFLGP